MSKAHKLNIREIPTQTEGQLRAEINCPSGCVTGYLWGTEEAIRKVVESMAGLHEADVMRTVS